MTRGSKNAIKVLVIEDEPDVALMLQRIISGVGNYTVATCVDEDAIDKALADVKDVDIVFTDLMMPKFSGFDIIEQIRQVDLDIPIVVVSAYSTLENAVQAIKLGAFDFLPKPFSPESVELILAKLQRDRKLRNRADEMCRLAHENDPHLFTILGESECIISLRDWICKVRDARTNILIEGESGTGKELVARAIHADKGPFVAINMAAIPTELAESELFGVKAGAFTGATNDRPGLIRQADSGTLFLDEIEAADTAIQAKLLRVLETRAVRPVGGTNEVKVDLQVLCASNQQLEEMVEKGTFRRDLYHRLKVLNIRVPALRQHPEDIKLLASFFIHRYCRSHKRAIRGLTGEALDYLTAREWPGNVRELENLIEQAVILCPEGQSEIDVNLLAGSSGKTLPAKNGAPNDEQHPPSLRDIENRYILDVIKQTDGNKSQAARILKIDYKTLLRKLSDLK